MREMNPLLVTAFFDVGRGTWSQSKRSASDYIDYFLGYQGKLDVPKYCLTDQDLSGLSQFDHLERVDIQSLTAFSYFDRTHAVMASPSFRGLFTAEDDRKHVEHLYPLYNIIMLAKWDALERAAKLTGYAHSHYVWMDFGIGRRGTPSAFLPAPGRFTPIERDRIVLAANRNGALRDLEFDTLTDHVRNFRDRVSGALQIVPRDHVDRFCELVRKSYERLLGFGLTTDDQLAIDMSIFSAPDLFFLSYPPPGISKFQHSDNIVKGLDIDRLYYRVPFIRDIGRKARRRDFLKRVAAI